MADNVARFSLVAQDDPNLGVSGWVGDGPVSNPSGPAGWEAVSRPKRVALTLWRGRDAPRIMVPFLFDRWREGLSVEDKVEALNALWGLGSDEQPPVLTIDGATIPRYAREDGRTWVIESVEWGDAIRRDSDGLLVRQAGSITLMEYAQDKRLAKLKRSTRPKYRQVNVRRGDTFAKIAKRELGAAKLARRLAKLNDARSVDVVLKRDHVKVPAGDELAKWKRGG